MRAVIFALSISLWLCACGGDPAGEPLLSGMPTGSYDGVEFVAVNGYATALDDGSEVILLGDGSVRCGSETASSPPSGHSAAVRPPSLDEGTYSDVFVQMYTNVGRFEGVGSGGGALVVTQSSAESVSGEIEFDYTSPDDRRFTLTGEFEALRCPD